MEQKDFGKSKIKNFSIERSCIAALLKFPEALFEFDAFLSEKDFFSQDWGKFYSIIRLLVIEKQFTKIDTAILLSTISNLGYKFSPQLNVTEIIQSLFNESKDAEYKSLKSLAFDILLFSKRRDMYECGDKISKKMVEKNFGSMQEIISAADELYFDSLQTFIVEDDIVYLGDGAREALNKLADNPVEHQGFSCGFKLWHESVGYFEPDTIHFVGARTKVGKSIFGLNVAANVANDCKVPVLYLDSELDNEKMRNRLVSHLSHVSIHTIECGQWRHDKSVCKRVEQAFNLIDNHALFPLTYKSTRGMGIDAILSACRRFLFKTVKRNNEGGFNPCLIVYDYIKIDYDNVSASDWAINVGRTVVKFKDFIGGCRASALMMGQTNRAGITKTDGKSNKSYNIDTEESVALSDEINKTNSSVSLLRYKSQGEIIEDGGENGNLLLLPLFSRNGKAGELVKVSEGIFIKDYINFERDGAINTFKELSLKSDILKSKSISSSLK